VETRLWVLFGEKENKRGRNDDREVAGNGDLCGCSAAMRRGWLLLLGWFVGEGIVMYWVLMAGWRLFGSCQRRCRG